MILETYRNYALSKPWVTEDTPFDETTLAFRVGNKIFSLCDMNGSPFSVNLKCDPEYAIELREQYPDAVVPGYHMSKKHWNTVYLEESGLTDEFIRKLVDHSYDLIFKSLSKIQREMLRSDE